MKIIQCLSVCEDRVGFDTDWERLSSITDFIGVLFFHSVIDICSIVRLSSLCKFWKAIFGISFDRRSRYFRTLSFLPLCSSSESRSIFYSFCVCFRVRRPRSVVFCFIAVSRFFLISSFETSLRSFCLLDRILVIFELGRLFFFVVRQSVDQSFFILLGLFRCSSVSFDPFRF